VVVCFVLFFVCVYLHLQICSHPKSIAGVPFGLVRRLRASLLLRTTCMHLCRNWVVGCVTVKQTKDQKPKQIKPRGLSSKNTGMCAAFHMGQGFWFVESIFFCTCICQWLFSQNVIQLQPNGSKTPIVFFLFFPQMFPKYSSQSTLARLKSSCWYGVWIPNLSVLPMIMIVLVSLTHLPCLFACFYESVSCVHAAARHNAPNQPRAIRVGPNKGGPNFWGPKYRGLSGLFSRYRGFI